MLLTLTFLNYLLAHSINLVFFLLINLIKFVKIHTFVYFRPTIFSSEGSVYYFHRSHQKVQQCVIVVACFITKFSTSSLRTAGQSSSIHCPLLLLPCLYNVWDVVFAFSCWKMNGHPCKGVVRTVIHCCCEICKMYLSAFIVPSQKCKEYFSGPDTTPYKH